MKRKYKVKGIKRYSPFANAVLTTSYPFVLTPTLRETKVNGSGVQAKAEKGYARVRTKANHKRNN